MRRLVAVVAACLLTPLFAVLVGAEGSSNIPPNAIATATFYQPVDVNVYVASSEPGASFKIVSTPAGIDCGATCTATFEYGSPLKLTAVLLNPETVFLGWEHIVCDEGQQSLTCSFIVPSIPPGVLADFTAVAASPPTAPPTPKPTPRPTAHATPKPTAHAATPQPAATSAPGQTSAPATSVGPAPSTEPVATGPAVSVAPLETPNDSQNASGQGGVPIVLILVVAALAVVVGGGAWYAARRGQKA